MRLNHRQSGFTLIELVISIALGIVAVSMIMFFYLSTITSSYATLKFSRLNQEMGSLMSIMVNEIRRAGYNGNTPGDPSANNFSDEAQNTKLLVGDTEFDPSSAHTSSCITFTYDRNRDGSVDTDEYVGFKLSSNEVFMRNAKGNCSSGSWEVLTDASDILVTSLIFDTANFQCMNASEPDGVDQDGVNGIDDIDEYNCYSLVPGSTDYPIASGDEVITSEVWIVTITLEASLADDTDTRVSMQQTLQVRNPHVSKVTP
ncbi:MAG: hypothetical protein RL336_1855 [Pseudomonadota bacterium]